MTRSAAMLSPLWALLLSAMSARAMEDFAMWSFHRPVALNTTASGAGVSGTVAAFAVLIRLNAANFNFTQAKADGADLRFSRRDGSPLPYQIERWDKALQLAEIWVKADTVRGNLQEQAFTMHWGEANAMDSANAGAVFDTADGYVSAWHLGETGNTTVDGYTDASRNGAHGQGANMKAENRIEGVVGWGQAFKAASLQSITIKSAARTRFEFQGTGDMTLSHWVKVQSNPGAFYTTVAKGDRSWRMSRSGGGNVLEFAVRNIKTNPALKDHDIADTKTTFDAPVWHLVTGVAKGPKLYMYVDGVKEDEQPMPGSVVNSEDDVALGFNSQYKSRYFDGYLDEVQILRVGQSADWAKLTYENQRPGGKLVSFPETAAIRLTAPGRRGPGAVGASLARRGNAFDAAGRKLGLW